jgi:ABC-2 type transport system ATP-binding protein
MGESLVLTDVTRTFGDRTALSGVSFGVDPGRMTGFVGANGAGKTTTMRIILGVLAADAGTVELGGLPLTREMRRRFGYMPEERGLYPRMTVLDQLVFLGRIHGLDAATARLRASDLLERLGLTERSRDLLQTLSLGNQQRVQVAAALVHDPTLLVLDEPFAGLDPRGVDVMAGHLRERADAGVPVLFSSHQLELVERLCDDVVIIDSGRVVAAGDARAVRTERAGRRLRLRVEPSDPSSAGGATTFLDGLPGVTVRTREGDRIEVDLDDAGDDQQVLAAAQRHGVVREFGPVLPTLAEIFREVVR